MKTTSPDPILRGYHCEHFNTVNLLLVLRICIMRKNRDLGLNQSNIWLSMSFGTKIVGFVGIVSLLLKKPRIIKETGNILL